MTSGENLPEKSNALRSILWGGLLAGALDLTAAIVTNQIRGIAPIRILQSIASGILGMESYQGGVRTAILGTALHFVITFGAAAVYYVAGRKLMFLVSRPIVSGLIFGIAVYWFMNLVVLPLSAFPHKIAFRPALVVTGLIVHMLCVGLPIALSVRRFSQTSATR